MTAPARDPDVGSLQLEGGIAVMIETAGLPIGRRVAATAIDFRPPFDELCELPRMDVLVAPGAIR